MRTEVRVFVVAMIVAGISHLMFGQATPELSGTIQDRAKAPIDGARIFIWEPETTNRMETTSTAGRYSFTKIPQGNYLLKAEKDGMALLFAAVRLVGTSQHELDLVLVENRSGSSVLVRAEPALWMADIQTSKSSTLAPAATPSAPSRIRPGSAIQARLLHQVAPVLPTSVTAAGLQSAVKVAGIIRTDGWMDDIIILDAPDPDFALATLMAVRQWRYRPTLLNGEAVEVVTTTVVNFHAR